MATTCSACDTMATTSCAVCRKSLCTAHAQQGQPFISARQLVATTTTTALRTPGMLGDVLFKELDLVSYCDECREDLAAKRTGEQLKVLLGMLFVLALVVGLPVYFMMFM